MSDDIRQQFDRSDMGTGRKKRKDLWMSGRRNVPESGRRNMHENEHAVVR